MRIRKRKVPFPLSSLSPVPLSDPNLRRSPVVQLQLEDDTAAYFNPSSSNPPIGDGNNPYQEEVKKEAKDSPKDEGGRDGETSNYTRRGSLFNAETETEMVFQESNSSHQDGRWCEGEKAFPLKKRRGNLERSKQEEETKEKKMKTKMNKKCQLQHNSDNNNNNQEIEEEKEIKESNTSTSKKKVRGGALMEGSRCSRVNGRGWRCCQQTLVGYSLCEHHLGKGRLRSMTSVRNRSMASSAAKKASSCALSPLPPQEDKERKDMVELDGEDKGNDDKKPLTISKKKMKLGVVKARSISSLLGQANNNNNNAIAMVDNNE
ncbi:hypothetical protein JCGZ_25554 [Jatropha curcas]|uniref:WRC domain-containing protein n=1 Tax=Jatropha curcas TaxID=180498 RepID=A0A067JP86_JATCU|nr:uncharacterized protein LOC105646530 [Jatropha curcas]KDP24638.1 hypothetical protein JCGZ_25554 [Jatropha curcas]